MFFHFPLPTNVGGENSFFFQIQLHVLGFLLLHKTRHNGQVQGILHGHTFVPFPGTALLLHWGHLCPWRTEGMKLASKERAILEKWWWNPPTKKSQTQTWERQGLVSTLCQAPGAALPWGTAGEAGQRRSWRGDAASHLAGLCLPLTAGPDCGRRFLAMASKCPLRAGDRLRRCVANKWRQHRCSCSQRCVGRSLCHHEAGSRTTSYACAEAHTGWQGWCQQRG